VPITGGWHALEQLERTPSDDEAILVYEQVGKIGVLHIDVFENGRCVGKWLQSATFCFLDEQPPEDALRTFDRWVAWATGKTEKITKGET
jgi:hypothetical protein